jgi:hypothetical protein
MRVSQGVDYKPAHDNRLQQKNQSPPYIECTRFLNKIAKLTCDGYGFPSDRRRRPYDEWSMAKDATLGGRSLPRSTGTVLKSDSPQTGIVSDGPRAERDWIGQSTETVL